MGMSENEISQISKAIVDAIEKQQEKHPPPPPVPRGERYFTQGVMLLTLAVLTFVGNTVWENSKAIVGIQGHVKVLHEASTGVFNENDGQKLEARVTDMEKEHSALTNAYNQITGTLNLHIAKSVSRFEAFVDRHHVVHEQVDQQLSSRK